MIYTSNSAHKLFPHFMQKWFFKTIWIILSLLCIVVWNCWLLTRKQEIYISNSITSTALILECSNIHLTVVGQCQSWINQCNSPILSISEPGFDGIVQDYHGRHWFLPHQHCFEFGKCQYNLFRKAFWLRDRSSSKYCNLNLNYNLKEMTKISFIALSWIAGWKNGHLTERTAILLRQISPRTKMIYQESSKGIIKKYRSKRLQLLFGTKKWRLAEAD